MKTKTIFKGVINGVEFDNVTDYNRVLTELMTNGVTVNASTSTSTVNVQDEDEDVRMLPGFDKMESDGKAYVNNYVTGDDETDSKKLANLANNLDSNLEKVIRKVSDMDYSALKEYEHDVKNVLDVIGQDMASTNDAIKSKTQELKVLENAMEVLKLWNENYKAYFDIIKDACTVFDKAHVKSDGKCSGECECKGNNDEEMNAIKSSCEDFTDALNDILSFFKGFNPQSKF